MNDIPIRKGTVVYWMQREQRVIDNHALLYAYNLSVELKSELLVIFCLVDDYLNATLRHYDFMLKGLMDVEARLNELNVKVLMLKGEPETEIPAFLQSLNTGAIVTDFNPLKLPRYWQNKINEKINVSFCVVDSHNVVPCRVASNKREYAAYTLRRKIDKVLPDFLYEDIGAISIHPFNKVIKCNNWGNAFDNLRCDTSVGVVMEISPGETLAEAVLDNFIKTGLNIYEENSNDPNANALSRLSPYLHFGQISSRKVAQRILKSNADEINKGAFLEQLIIRKELADNFCFYNNDYDNIYGIPDWAMKTLQLHVTDEREYLYSLDIFENAQTHDELWNAAQRQLVNTGIIHSYVRMYWAKKILDWCETPEKALEIAIYLNDKYALDGRDPNGYTGIMWSICGVHDRPWPERPVFGKIRYMNDKGCKRKFDVKKYIEKNRI